MADASPRIFNLLTDAQAPAKGERFDTLLNCRNAVIERIVSAAGVVSEVFVQPQDEWVMLVQGRAVLRIGAPGDTQDQVLGPGDHVFIPAGMPHQVIDTLADTVWLAVHLHPEPNERP